MVLDSWLWAIEPTHFRVLFTILAQATPTPTQHRSPVWGVVDVPAGGLVTSLDRLADRATVSRSVVRRALERLEAGPNRDGIGGIISVSASSRGFTLITVTDLAMVVPCAQCRTGASHGSYIENDGAPDMARSQRRSPSDHSGGHSNETAGTASSTAGQRKNASDHGALSGDPSAAEHSAEHSNGTGDPPISVGTNHALSDQDPGSERDVPPTKGKRTRLRADLITNPRAWAGADYLRAKLLEIDPGNIVGRKPWDDDVREGLRLTWANEIRLMVEADHRGREKPDVRDDRRSYDEIARTIAWVFGDQGTEPKYRIVVESAGSLRAKWDQIQAARRRQQASSAAPARTNQPPTAYRNPPPKETWR